MSGCAASDWRTHDQTIEVPEEAYVEDGDGSKSLCWHLVDCGGFRIAGINAEPVVRYRRLLQHTLGGPPLPTASCLDQTHCYLPIDEMLGQRGYEVTASAGSSGSPAASAHISRSPSFER